MFLRLSGISALECARRPCAQPQHEKKWNQRRHEEDGAAAAVNETVNHLWTYVHTEKSDDYDAKSVRFLRGNDVVNKCSVWRGGHFQRVFQAGQRVSVDLCRGDSPWRATPFVDSQYV